MVWGFNTSRRWGRTKLLRSQFGQTVLARHHHDHQFTGWKADPLRPYYPPHAENMFWGCFIYVLLISNSHLYAWFSGNSSYDWYFGRTPIIWERGRFSYISASFQSIEREPKRRFRGSTLGREENSHMYVFTLSSFSSGSDYKKRPTSPKLALPFLTLHALLTPENIGRWDSTRNVKSVVW